MRLRVGKWACSVLLLAGACGRTSLDADPVADGGEGGALITGGRSSETSGGSVARAGAGMSGNTAATRGGASATSGGAVNFNGGSAGLGGNARGGAATGGGSSKGGSAGATAGGGGAGGSGGGAGGGEAGAPAEAGAGGTRTCDGVFRSTQAITQQSDCAAFRGVRAIDGNLVISGAVNDLSALECLSEVNGSLQIADTTTLTGLKGLENLTSVRGGIRVLRNRDLRRIDGLNVREMPSLRIQQNTALAAISGFSSLPELALLYINNRSLREIRGFEALTSVGDLTLEQDEALSDVDWLGSLRTAGNVTISGCSSLTHVNGLSSLTSVKGLAIKFSGLRQIDGLRGVRDTNLWLEGNDSLTNVDGLANLTSAGDVVLASNASLADYAGLGQLRTVRGDFTIAGNAAGDALDFWSLVSIGGALDVSWNRGLTGLTAFHSLISLNELAVFSNHDLTSFEGLENLVALPGGLSVEENPDLLSLAGLAALASVTRVNIYYNPSLQSLTGLEGLTSSEDLFIVGNAALRKLVGLNGLQRLGGSLSLENNPVLSDLQALSALESVGGSFTIENNPSLATCEAQWLQTHTEPQGQVVIEGNNDAGVCVP